ncbi:3-oxoacyl-[acyl-carrier-protein] reductase [Corynebacterium sp. 13CS0277]|uniref:SDR family oxidoreductase n=1 Tax=Corynebacterium sp. 13CS0277 TaxID=2071994 RepID=UPI000D03C1BC|nr:SDR family oxidoreductase [Corynebacterium sp. 13CS0277]PRQ12236.1 3-oxoacyl-[acyl-carrier-protein] reductase [Corynebacterium sp. 13CS0277]
MTTNTASSNQALAGRVALVTGGAQGIGQGIARVLRGQGATVYVTGLTDADMEAGAAAGFPTLQADASDADAMGRAVAQVVDEQGALDILVANAGIYPQQRIDELTLDEVMRVLKINVGGTVVSVKAAKEALTKSEAGRIVVVSSITGNFTGYPGWSHYGASKAAQMGFVRSAALELAPQGVTINAVLPGNIRTAGLDALGEDYVNQMARSVPLGYLGDPEDIGEAVAFLASPGARYITGQEIIVDGGQLLPESMDALNDM